jgi:hypothetical protein
MFNFDDNDIFAGDADIEQHQLEQAANRIEALKKQGICIHGHLQGTKCLECNKTWDNEDAMYAEITELYIEHGI